MGATHLGMVVTDFSAHVIEEREFPFSIKDGPNTCLPKVDSILQELLKRSGISMRQVRAIGIGVPGPVVVEAGSVGAPPIMPGWDGYPIRSTS